MRGMIIAVVCVMAFVFAVTRVCKIDRRNLVDNCLETKTDKTTAYPGAGMMALGGAYIGMATAPTVVDREVCVKREPRQEGQ